MFRKFFAGLALVIIGLFGCATSASAQSRFQPLQTADSGVWAFATPANSGGVFVFPYGRERAVVNVYLAGLALGANVQRVFPTYEPTWVSGDFRWAGLSTEGPLTAVFSDGLGGRYDVVVAYARISSRGDGTLDLQLTSAPEGGGYDFECDSGRVCYDPLNWPSVQIQTELIHLYSLGDSADVERFFCQVPDFSPPDPRCS